MVADHKIIKHQIAIAKGQLDGVSKMIDEDAYCIDVSNQLLATISILKKTNQTILTEHLSHCIKNAKNGEELDSKIKEISDVLKRM